MRQSEANLDNLKSNRRTIMISSLDVALEVDIQELEREGTASGRRGRCRAVILEELVSTKR